MAEAARKLGMHFNTFKRHAVKLGCYATNPSGKGVLKPRIPAIPTEDILAGKYPDYETYKLKRRLIREGYMEDRCQRCGWAEKREPEDEFTPCELHHIDGNPRNHAFAICGYIAQIAIRYNQTIGQRIEQIARDDYTECQ